MTDNRENKILLRALDRVLRETAESSWLLSLLFKFSIFVAGTLLIFIPSTSQVIPFVVIFLTLAAEFFSWRYSSAREDFIKICFDFRTAFCVSAKFGSYAARNMFP